MDYILLGSSEMCVLLQQKARGSSVLLQQKATKMQSYD